MDKEVKHQSLLISEITAHFGYQFQIDKIIATGLPVGRSVKATILLTTKKMLLIYIKGDSKLLLTDIKKIISRMGMIAELYLPPKGQPQYFDEIGKKKFCEVFPGRQNVSSQDIIFYKTLSPYNPALVQIKEIKNSEIYQFDSDSSSSWRLAMHFSYRRIKTS